MWIETGEGRQREGGKEGDREREREREKAQSVHSSQVGANVPAQNAYVRAVCYTGVEIETVSERANEETNRGRDPGGVRVKRCSAAMRLFSCFRGGRGYTPKITAVCCHVDDVASVVSDLAGSGCAVGNRGTTVSTVPAAIFSTCAVVCLYSEPPPPANTEYILQITSK